MQVKPLDFDLALRAIARHNRTADAVDMALENSIRPVRAIIVRPATACKWSQRFELGGVGGLAGQTRPGLIWNRITISVLGQLGRAFATLYLAPEMGYPNSPV
jgi:hypothetical protein